jgi:hypothetical protein
MEPAPVAIPMIVITRDRKQFSVTDLQADGSALQKIRQAELLQKETVRQMKVIRAADSRQVPATGVMQLLLSFQGEV